MTVAALAAIYGVGAWRNEFAGKKRIDLAEDVLVRFYEARDAIRAIRSPFAFAGEGSTRQASERETAEEKQALDQAFVAVERYEKHSEVFHNLRSLRYRFMAQFGSDSVHPFDDLNDILNRIFISARMLGRYYWRERNRPTWRSDAEEQKHIAQTEKYEAMIWESVEDDDIASSVDGAVSQMEKICSRVIRREPKGWFGWLPVLRLPVLGRREDDRMQSASEENVEGA